MFLQFVWLGHPLHGSTATRGGLGIFVQILGLEGGGSLLRSRVMTRLPSDRRTDARWLNGLGTAWNSFSPTATRAGHALLPWRGAVLALDWDSRGRAPYSYSVVAWFGGWRCKFSSVAGLTRCWKTPFWEVVCANDTQKKILGEGQWVTLPGRCPVPLVPASTHNTTASAALSGRVILALRLCSPRLFQPQCAPSSRRARHFNSAADGPSCQNTRDSRDR